MLLTFRNDVDPPRQSRQSFPVFAYFALLPLLQTVTEARMYEGDSCTIKGITGVCKLSKQCATIEAVIDRGDFTVQEVGHCGFDTYDEIICCPLQPVIVERPAARACRKIDEGLQPLLIPAIIGGIKVGQGEFPHMAAIGYNSISGDSYEFLCGGTLIDKRFVLTAAHCVNTRGVNAAIVRLGVTNFKDPEQMRDAVEIRIKTTHIHPEYSNSRKYNDIALLELERDVTFSNNIYPTCLYTDLNDPPGNEMLYVTGWGVINTSTKERSDILLKASLQVVSVDRCNERYLAMGPNRQLIRGVEKTQICAIDRGFAKDACQGDSGGPLQMVADNKSKKYRVLGIVSAGFNCGTSTPGLYTRVAAFLDYIENIVWPTAA